jgi:hypothetical protein
MRSFTQASNSLSGFLSKLVGAALTFLILSSTPVFAKKPKTPPPALPASGDVLIAGGVTSGGSATNSAEFYSVSFRQFVATGTMSTGRATHQSEILFPTEESDGDTGKIFMIGGFSGSAKPAGSSIGFDILALDNFELYDPTTGTFAVPTTPLLQPMTSPRAFFPVIDLPADADHDHGHFLAIAGLCNAPDLNACRTSDVIHPDDHVTSTGDPIVGRMMHTATLLQNETSILVTGGFGDLAGTALNSAEILDTNTDTFTATPAMNGTRAGQTATILNDGTVLIAGGFDASGAAQKSAEIFDPVSGTFAPVASPMHDRRAWHTATLLSDGRVLFTGGFNGSAKIALTGAASGVTGSWSASSGSVLSTAEIFDPGSKTFTCIHGSIKKTGVCKKSMKATRMDHTATLLADGDVLVAGGFGGKSGIQPTNSAELLHAGKFVKTGSMTAARAWHSAIAIQLGL